MAEVEGERSLFEKLAPFIDSAKAWLESEYLGHDDFLSERHNDLALKVLVSRAFLFAVPSLDLVLTPSGFGVVSTESMAPASKERVERLTSSLESYIKANLEVLVDVCRQYPEWRESDRGRYFGATFFPSLHDYSIYFADTFSSYDRMRDACIEFETILAKNYLGTTLMTSLRAEAFAFGKDHSDVFNAIRVAIIKLSSTNKAILDQNAFWHVAKPVIEAIKYDGELYQIWHSEMGELFESPAFKNNIKGGFYF